MAKLIEQKTLDAYKQARNALNNIVRSRQANEKQKKRAKAARRKLTLDFIKQQESELAARTKQFQRFIRDMEGVIKSIGKNSPIAALKTLIDVVDKSKNMVEKIKTVKKEASG